MSAAATPPTIITELPRLPQRPIDGHKGTFGRVLVIAGSRGMAGAAILAGSAALRAGAGLVKIAVPEGIQDVVALGQPCATTAGLAQDRLGRFALSAETELIELTNEADVVAIGPGMGQSESLAHLVWKLIRQIHQPLILDADGLNVLAPLPPNAFRKRDGPLLLTPHPGEFARLTGMSSAAVQEDRSGSAVRFAREQQVLLVLKGHGTLVTEGERLYRNPSGNPGMATGGSGDVLTGMIAALLAQRLDPFAAAQIGVYVHGRAGDLAAAELGELSLTALDLVGYSARAFVEFAALSAAPVPSAFGSEGG